MGEHIQQSVICIVILSEVCLNANKRKLRFEVWTYEYKCVKYWSMIMPLNQPYFTRTSVVIFFVCACFSTRACVKNRTRGGKYVCIYNIEQSCLGCLALRFRMQMHACITFVLKGSHLWSVDLHIKMLYRSWAQTNFSLSLAMRDTNTVSRKWPVGLVTRRNSGQKNGGDGMEVSWD